MAKVVNKPGDRTIRSILAETERRRGNILSQDEVDAMLAPTREELLEDSNEETEMRRARLRVMLSNGGVLDDLYVDFVTRFGRIHKAYDRELLSDSQFDGQATSLVQDYLLDLEAGVEVGMKRDPYLVELEVLSMKYEGRDLRERAYFALRSCLKERDCSV